MKISQKGIDLLKEFEGFEAKPYLCSAGKKTIGYGHVILVGENFDSVSIERAEALLRKDVEIAEKAINLNVDVKISQYQFDAIACFVFNVGVGAFIKSTLREKLNMGDYKGASEQFLRWDKVNGKSVAGLLIRRKKERALFDE